MQTNIETRQQEIISEFNMFQDWMQKYEYIIELGKDLPLLDENKRSDELLIKGCQSKVWLHAEENVRQQLRFKADSDAIITKGLVALVIRVFDGEQPSDILQTDLHFIKAIGLHEHLSPTRSNGLAGMVQQIKNYALAYQLKHTTQG
jgi:cysteine desulfuration protein SufE